MLGAFKRKLRKLIEDPVARCWLLARLLGRSPGPPPFTAGLPPYLGDLDWPPADLSVDPGTLDTFGQIRETVPSQSITLELPGERITVEATDADALFTRTFVDMETFLAVHRFAWVPLFEAAIDPAWVDTLWRCWTARYAAPDDSWIWHPYTAAERAINILDFARRHGLPGDRALTAEILARHVSAIAVRLEYFGDHDTGNHLANNGRGLYRLGIDLGIEQVAAAGLRILLSESQRIFLSSGMLREGSTHYHLLLTRNYLDAWLAARRKNRPETSEFEAIARRLLAPIRHFDFVGGMPLIGDISPDCPPSFLYGLLPRGDEASGWGTLRDIDEISALGRIKKEAETVPVSALVDDGWIDSTYGSWRSLWYVAPDGWPPIPGHAHQDIGSGEIHFDNVALIVDPGRGAYGEDGEATYFVSAAAHNSLRIDDIDPYPPNKPYYDSRFRRLICGSPPLVERHDEGLAIEHGGFTRLNGIGRVRRNVRFHARSLQITDRVAGWRFVSIVRRLHTPWTCDLSGDSVVIRAPQGLFRVRASERLVCSTSKRWIAYGVAAPAWTIEARTEVRLPCELTIEIERL